MTANMRHILSLAVVAVLSVGGFIAYKETIASNAQAPDRPAARAPGGPRSVAVEVGYAEHRSLPIVLEAVGTTRALRSINIVPQDEGRIVTIDVAAGREIEAGAVLARLDDESERATLAEAEANLEQKSRALERADSLARSNNVSQSAVDIARSERAVAQAALDRARANLADREVSAPFAGVLGITSVDLGARVDTDTVLTTLDDLTAVEIEFTLPETVYGQVRSGQPITATSAAYTDRTFAGTVASVDSRIDSTSRAFTVRARLPNDDRALPAGMFMQLNLAIEARDAVMVPEEAIVIQAGQPTLFVVVEGQAERRAITTDLRRDGLVEVVSGVAPGETVVTRGVQSLRDGARVRIAGGDGGADSRPVEGREQS